MYMYMYILSRRPSCVQTLDMMEAGHICKCKCASYSVTELLIEHVGNDTEQAGSNEDSVTESGCL